MEVRSVNNRYLDCTVKMPRMYSFAEDAVKRVASRRPSPGARWMCSSRVDASAADVSKVTVNRELAGPACRRAAGRAVRGLRHGVQGDAEQLSGSRTS
ncbi:MAG: YicC/YloC family endoribonuclease [Dysosmobacter sp.]